MQRPATSQSMDLQRIATSRVNFRDLRISWSYKPTNQLQLANKRATASVNSGRTLCRTSLLWPRATRCFRQLLGPVTHELHSESAGIRRRSCRNHSPSRPSDSSDTVRFSSLAIPWSSSPDVVYARRISSSACR